MVFGSRTVSRHTELDRVVQNLEEVEYLVFRKSFAIDSDCSKDVSRQVQKAEGAITGFSTVWKRKV